MVRTVEKNVDRRVQGALRGLSLVREWQEPLDSSKGHSKSPTSARPLTTASPLPHCEVGGGWSWGP